MIPVFESLPTDEEIEEENEITATWKFNKDTKTICGTVDGIEAIKQTVFMILNTERQEHEIYSEDYGAELIELTGMQTPLVYVEIQDAIKDALMEDDRIEDVNHFSFETKGYGVIAVSFSVVTEYGDFWAEKEVSI